jgi:hypothetical protein
MDDNSIKFVYKGESLVYTIAKEEIAKITFSSGRTETFAKSAPSSAATPSGGQTAIADIDHHNRVAILPFSYIMDGQPSNDELGMKVQNECFSIMSSHAGPYAIVDNNTVNAMLIKAGVNRGNIAGYTMQELCDLLGVEFLVSGVITVDRTSQTNYSSGSEATNYNSKKNGKSSSSYSYGSSTSTNTQNYATTLDLKMYTDKGVTIYSKDRRSFWSTQDAYKSTLEYLLKRSPLYLK